MNTITLILSIAAVIWSIGASAIAVNCRKRLDALEAAPAGPDVGTMGAGGGGRR